MSDRTGASNTPIEQARQSRRLHAGHPRGTALERILTASLDLARAERTGHGLNEAELMILDCCDEIGGVRDIVAHTPAPRDPANSHYDF